MNDKVQARLLKLLQEWKDASDVVQDDIQSYAEGFSITKLQISKDVYIMKTKFKQISAIMKEL